jgi:hypothetical protein
MRHGGGLATGAVRLDVGGKEVIMKGRNRNGSSVSIELLTVVAIVLITASLPTPRVHKELIPAHEASVLAGIKAIHEGEMWFARTHPDQGFARELATLASTDNDGGEPIIDNVLASGRKSGYTLTYTPGEKINGAIRSYTITAVPDLVGTTGRRRFYSDESGEIRDNASGSANAGSRTIR